MVVVLERRMGKGMVWRMMLERIHAIGVKGIARE
jgi:hypothetical protein